MSKKITHKEHRQLLSELYKRQGGKWIYQADAYIKQQEKKEKLLGQYKKVASAIVRTSIEQPIYVIRESEREMVEQSFNKIKELENE